MTMQRYPRTILRNDYIRAGGGVALCVPLAAVSQGSSFGFWLFVGLTLLFAVFGARTWLRGRAEYRLTEAGLLRTNVALKGQAATGIAWSELSGLTLRFYPLRRDRSDGWMQLIVRGSGARLSIDSTLEDFDAIAEAALAAGLRNDLPMTQTTLANFRALGFSPEKPADSG
ncbi:MAG: hypothetical protein OXC10_18405 [Rhodospirillaceae bacterium]|nr:hypothetical protein [Rhodospirillaceae bacterium]